MKRDTALQAYKRLAKEVGQQNVDILHDCEPMEPQELHEAPRKYVDHITEYDSSVFDDRPNKRYIISVTW